MWFPSCNILLVEQYLQLLARIMTWLFHNKVVKAESSLETLQVTYIISYTIK